MQVKNAEIGSLLSQKEKIQRMYDELKEKMTKMRKQEQAEMQEIVGKQREKEAEIEVLKEMIKGIKVQLKCKYTKLVIRLWMCSEGY